MKIEVDTDYDSIDVLKQAHQRLADAIAAKEPKQDESSGFMNIFDMPLGESSEKSSSSVSHEASTPQQTPHGSSQVSSVFDSDIGSQQTANVEDSSDSENEEQEEKPQITIIDY